MADKTFTWPTQATKNGNDAFRFLSVQFGQGYRQTAADGINAVSDSWNIEVKGTFGSPGCLAVADVEAVREFLREHGGWKAFNWTSPDGRPAEYLCAGSSYQQNGRVFTLSATFERRFGV